jgi:hypothetical protein
MADPIRIHVNGVDRDATADEIAALAEAQAQIAADQPED